MIIARRKKMQMEYDSIESRVSIGVLRYDTKTSNDKNNFSFNALQNNVWGSMGYWSFCADVDKNGNLISFGEDAEGVIEHENQYAYDSGIDYWIFCDFTNALRDDVILHNYLNSSNKKLVKFCKFIMWEDIGKMHFNLDHLKDPQWFTVLDNRPLIFVYGGSIKDPDSAILEIRNYTINTLKLPDPYVVLFNKSGYGEDCNSDYAPGAWDSDLVATPYSSLIRSVAETWNIQSATSNNYIPNAIYNWDPRPWRATPAPWVLNPITKIPYLPGYWTVPPTGEEYRQMLQSGVNFVLNNPCKCPSMTIISKEWNGQEEGGNICPSLRYGSEACDGIKIVDKSNVVIGPIIDTSIKDFIELRVYNGEVASIDNRYMYVIFSDKPYTFQPGDFIEYDVILMDNQAGAGGIDIKCNDGSYFKNHEFNDQNDIPGFVGIGSLTEYANNVWYHRKLEVPSAVIGKTACSWMLAGENNDINRQYTSLYDNLTVTDGRLSVRDRIFNVSTDSNICEVDSSSDAGMRLSFINI